MTILGVLVGVAVISPATPVCQTGRSCTKPAAHVTIEFTKGAVTRSVVTTSSGTYRIRLAAGRYEVHVARARISPATVTVARGTTHRNLSIDTGIR